jgi:hypothetical protein
MDRESREWPLSVSAELAGRHAPSVLVVRRRSQDAVKVVKRTVEATTDEITSGLQEALKS